MSVGVKGKSFAANMDLEDEVIKAWDKHEEQ